MSLELPQAAEALIPHRKPLRLVDRLLSVEGNRGVVEACIDSECPLLGDDGVLEDVALSELVAQGFAALKGYRDRQQGKPVRQGFLVGIKQLVRLESVRVGDCLRIEIESLAELDDFAMAEGQIWRAEQLVARGEIKVWIE